MKSINRRRLQRVEKSLPAWYRFDQCTFRRGSVLDVSEGGARLTSPEAMPDGDVHVTIKLAEQHLTYVARPAWQRALPNGKGYVVGLRFTEAAVVDSGRLSRWVQRQVQLRALAAG